MCFYLKRNRTDFRKSIRWLNTFYSTNTKLSCYFSIKNFLSLFREYWIKSFCEKSALYVSNVFFFVIRYMYMFGKCIESICAWKLPMYLLKFLLKALPECLESANISCDTYSTIDPRTIAVKFNWMTTKRNSPLKSNLIATEFNVYSLQSKFDGASFYFKICSNFLYRKCKLYLERYITIRIKS